MKIKLNHRYVVLLLTFFSVFNFGYGQNKGQNQHQSPNSVFISGELRDGLDIFDTVYIEVFDDFLAEYDSGLPYRSYAVPFINGKYSLRIDSIYKLTYFNVSTSKLKGRASIVNIHAMRNLIMMPGDSINLVNQIMKVIPGSYVSYGHGAEKYTCLNSIERITDLMKKLFALNFVVDRQKRTQQSIVQEIDERFFNHDTIYRRQKQILDQYQSRLSSHISDVISINLQCENLLEKFKWLHLSINIFKRNDIDANDYLPILYTYEKDIEASLHNLFYTFSDSVLVDSYALPKCLHEYLLLKELLSKRTFDILEHIRFVENQSIRDKILFLYYLQRHGLMRRENSTAGYPYVKNITNPLYRDILSKVVNSIVVGSEAYNFNLPDVNNKRVQLSDFRGKVVFIDFWFTGCGGCAEYYKNVLEPVKKYFKGSTDVVFITISIDANIAKWKKAIASGYYTSDDAINLYTDGLGSTHPVIKHYGVMAYPRPLLIDKNGLIFNASNQDLRTGGADKLIALIEQCNMKE